MPHPLIEQIEERIFSVREYLELTNELLAPLKVSVEGEISDLKVLPQWVFFSLKDSESGEVLRCGLHSGVYRRLGVSIEEGMSVKVFGYGKISPKTGNFGFWVSKIEPIGEGALRRAYELLVKKLESEGLFSRKRELPKCISHIGIISSRNGVVVQDLMKNLDPLGIRVDFVHSGVEGASSAEEILRAIEYFNTKDDRPQILVVIRGGGSLESLQGFNNEAVARALFASPVPVLVGIGHDVDAPIATLVADWSASTPTAVAHVINESWHPLTREMPELAARILKAFERRISGVRHRTELASRGIRHGMTRFFARFEQFTRMIMDARKSIRVGIHDARMRVDRSGNVFQKMFTRGLRVTRQRLSEFERLLEARDPSRILLKGFGMVYHSDGTLVRSVTEVKMGETLRTRLKDGTVDSTVTTTNKTK